MTYYAVYEKQELSKQTVSRSGVEVNQKRFVIKLFAQQNKSEKNIKKLADYNTSEICCLLPLFHEMQYENTTERR
jgi:hypothetical protein